MADVIKMRNKRTGKIQIFRKKTAPAIFNNRFLPGNVRTENKIAAREAERPQDIAMQNIEDVKRPFTKPSWRRPFDAFMPHKPIVSAVRGAGALLPRAEAAVANPLLDIQEGKVSPGRLATSFAKGVTGERLGQFGDPIRKQLYGRKPEWMPQKLYDLTVEGASGAAGLGALSGIFRAMSALASKANFPKFMGREWKVNQAKTLHKGVVDARKAVGKEYSDIYSQPNLKKVKELERGWEGLRKGGLKTISRTIDDTPLSTKEVANALDSAPKPLLEELLGLKKGQFKVLKPTIKRLREWRRILQSEMSQGTWTKGAQMRGLTIKEGAVKEVYYKLKDVILNNVDDASKAMIKKADARYHKVMTKGGGIIRDIYDTKTQSYSTKKMLAVWKDSEKAGRQEIYRDLTDYSTDISEFIKEMRGYGFRKKVYGGVGAGLGYWALRKAIQSGGKGVEEITGAVPSGGGGGQ